MLLDHFHPPFSDSYGWQGFHSQWASAIAADLNQRLPEGWRAETEIEFGIKVDVGVIEELEAAARQAGSMQSDWEPPTPTLTIPFVFTTDTVEIRVYNRSYGPSLMGAIELVSPANKDRWEHRAAFTTKCLNMASEGAGVTIVDIVTKRHGNFHGEIVKKIGVTADYADDDLYASAYAPTNDGNHAPTLRAWYERLEVGKTLPTMPLHLRVGPMMALDLEATYQTACRQLRIRM